MQSHYIRTREKNKHLTGIERGKIEALHRQGWKAAAIAAEIQVSIRTIYRELRRGEVTLKSSDWRMYQTYSADAAQARYEARQHARQGTLKIGKERKLAEALEVLIKDKHCSPYAALEQLRKCFEIPFCLKTLYNYIHRGLFLRVKSEDLPNYRRKKAYAPQQKRIAKRGGRSIDERAPEIAAREECGHWEMDTVVGKVKTRACLLVLTERKTRREIVRKMRDKSMESVIQTFDEILRSGAYSKEDFKTITSDNGSEFMNVDHFEGLGIPYFYAHSFCSYERGSNENNNRLIRRFIPKGRDIGDYTDDFVQKIEDFMNNYPRKLFSGKSANEMYAASKTK
ncbi:IS30 family transposase [Selenomonas montiformis]|uniref:IS30 family transposase n=1 Tax=Selenomonas montiformis TaxID=2652285 RepID=UPI003F8BBCAA